MKLLASDDINCVSGGITNAELRSMLLMTLGGAVIGCYSGTLTSLNSTKLATVGLERGWYMSFGTVVGAVFGFGASIVSNT